MPRGVRFAMNLVQVAKEHCANWDDGKCFGWSVEALKNAGQGYIKVLDQCCLKDGHPCDYFERCVLASRAMKREDPEVMFRYKAALEQNSLKSGLQVTENKGSK
jgi:hypothetical protein